ncbi:RagB/SusD family nutrient uptake outer membrane protein, partial [Flavobacteriaceae bacterium]|nr:RagB/SusD family nutrient uptake outer membrane protein [Flavobacteriaceae bacterium]
LRALTYFNLVRFYGDVPLHLEELIDLDDLEIVNKPRVSASLIYDAIIDDLIFAEEHLYLASWVSDENKPSYEGDNLGRATVGAAKGLLAKVYLTRASFPERDLDSYQLAFDKAEEIITDARYTLDPDYYNLNSLEGKTSQEWMFQIQYNVLGQQTSNWGGLHNPLNQGTTGRNANDWGYGRVSPTFKFANSFEVGDLRSDTCAKGRINADGSIHYIPRSNAWYSHKYRFSSRPLSRFNNFNTPVRFI